MADDERSLTDALVLKGKIVVPKLLLLVCVLLGIAPVPATAQARADTFAVWEGLLQRLHGREPIVLDRRIRQLKDPQQLGPYHDPRWLDSLVASKLIAGTCDSSCFPGFQSDTMYYALGVPDFTSQPGNVLLFRATIMVGGRRHCPEYAEDERDEIMVPQGGRWSRLRSKTVTTGYFDSHCAPPVRYGQ